LHGLLPACRSISPRAFANDDDTNANITCANCAFVDNVFDSWGCLLDPDNYWWCYFAGPAGAAGVTTASDVTFKGFTTLKNNTWGALYAASPITVTFEGAVVVADNTKEIGDGDAPSSTWRDQETPKYGAGMYAAAGAHLLFLGSAVFK
jgi:hypothetical protein